MTLEYQNKKTEIQLPSAWKELYPYLQRSSFCRALLTLNDFVIKVDIAEKLLSAFRHNTAHTAWVVPHIQVSLSKTADLDWSSHHHLNIWGMRYDMPRMMMENSTILEFIAADKSLEKYVTAISSGDVVNAEKYMYRIMGILCRPATGSNPNDRRVPFKSMEQADIYGRIFQRYADTWVHGRQILRTAAICVITVLSTKNFIADNYIPHLTGGNGAARGIDFGWDSVVMDIAENGAMGDMDTVYNTNVHQVMLFCIKKTQDAAIMEAAMNKT